MMEKPPFKITLQILDTISGISEILGELKSYASISKPSLKLRKENKIKTIQFSLAIEGNTLDTSQITALIDNKRILGPKKEILEVQNAIHLYDQIEELDPLNEKDFLNAHKILMGSLVDRPGKYRTTAVGIFKNGQISKFSPPAKQVGRLMDQLFLFLKDKETSAIIKACVFHYELELIHPFLDGNGRMGRLWQQIILMSHSPVFEYISVESIVFKKQKEYYKALEESDKNGESTPFIEFSLKTILEGLKEYQSEFKPKKPSAEDRIVAAIEFFKSTSFTRKDYQNIHKSISAASASRDLAEAVKSGRLTIKGVKATSRYKKK